MRRSYYRTRTCCSLIPESIQPHLDILCFPTSGCFWLGDPEKIRMAFTFAAFCYILALILTAVLIFFAIFHVRYFLHLIKSIHIAFIESLASEFPHHSQQRLFFHMILYVVKIK